MQTSQLEKPDCLKAEHVVHVMCQLVHWVLWAKRSLACLCRARACPVQAHGVPCVRQGTWVACNLRALAGYGCAWAVPMARQTPRHHGRVQWRAHTPATGGVRG